MSDRPGGSSPGPETPNIQFFSFWKPDPVPPRDATILPVELHSLGKLEEVTSRLFEVPRMTEVPPAPWEAIEAEPQPKKLRWQVEEGVILKVRCEQGPPKPGEVLTIEAASSAPTKTFYRLYVQIYEQFGATVLDEKSHLFLSPREFRANLAG
ncbi:MAG: hypothetical protein M5U26_12135 [Planctomycetota bacterium]|nr:hypothetical protein [Planctomycetota bacterium]